MDILKVKVNGEWVGIPAIVGPKGDKGDKGDKGNPGESGTTDYTDLENKPQIGGVTLSGNKSLDDLGAAAKTDTVLNTTLSMGRKANTTVGTNSVATGDNVTASSYSSHAEGTGTTASNTAAHAEGGDSTASGMFTHAEGYGTTASGTSAHAEGSASSATEMGAHAEGGATTASGMMAHSEGSYTTASKTAAHAEGDNTVASATAAHAEGTHTIAAGTSSHVVGKYNVADSYDSWNEWTANTAYVVGDKVKRTTTSNGNTIVTGYICKTANSDSSFTYSKWTNQNGYTNYAEIVGNGTADNARSNARTLDWDGNERVKGNLYVGCNADSSGGTRVPHDIQVNGTSIVNNGVANIPVAGENTIGAVKVAYGYQGLYVHSTTNQLIVSKASDSDIKTGTNQMKPIVPDNQDKSVFYGLAKAAGDSTQAVSDNAVGTYTAGAKSAIKTMLGVSDPSVTDVQVNGTSVMSQGVANVPIASYSDFGVTKFDSGGFFVSASGAVFLNRAVESTIKEGTNDTKPIVPARQYASVFYGLAKAAGDSTQASSSNTVGTFTDSAKSAINTMLNGAVSVTGTTPTITGLAGLHYICGEVSTLSVTAPETGCIDVVFTSGSTATVLTVTSAKANTTIKWANGFDPTSLDANTTYEINILNGEFGVAGSWT